LRKAWQATRRAAPLLDISPETKDFVEHIERDAQDFWKNVSAEEKIPENHKELQGAIRDLKAYALEITSPSSAGVGLMDEVNQKLGVFSLSRTFSNLLMWSHYADSHKGFVIGLDESHEFFHQRTYQGLKSAPNKISYTTQRSITHVSDSDFYAKLLCEKPIDWAYEEEVRIFRHITEEHAKNCVTDSAGYPVCLFKLPKECIKSIYIGAHAQSVLKESILGFKKFHDLCADVYETKISKNRYELECQKCV
jgi:hypothetical protein